MACGESDLTIFPCVLGNVLITISHTTGLSFALKRIGPLAEILLCCFYLLVLKFLVTIKPHKNLSCSIYSEALVKSTCQHLLLLVGFDALTYRKDHDRSPTLVGHHSPERATDLLELVHTDVCGPMSTTARGGFHYFITFNDDFSRYGYVYLMQHKY